MVYVLLQTGMSFLESNLKAAKVLFQIKNKQHGTYLKSTMVSIWSLIARTKSSCPPIWLVTMANLCQEYLLKMLSMADDWCSTDGASCSTWDSGSLWKKFDGKKSIKMIL
ncbi:hypothetical protein CEXT_679601 [Caerostris extrusa]|uniref:Uncharacterized protein n=1 Tax=Caerostris extrusa TaxID=172846 RepID=A0AAV4WVF7_CAEEX|nr:hypothetical protein CEXT_679601 [Caerostris extrusa]